jgi:hypothetical protein
VVEAIGEGGRVDLVLGEFFSYASACLCSREWSESNPADLRLPCEREVDLRTGMVPLRYAVPLRPAEVDSTLGPGEVGQYAARPPAVRQ